MPQPTHQNAALERDYAVACAVKAEAKKICEDQGYLDAAHAIQNLLAVNVCVDSALSHAPQAEEAELPPLPERPTRSVLYPDSKGYVLAFTAGQMRSYALAARADLVKQNEELRRQIAYLTDLLAQPEPTK